MRVQVSSREWQPECVGKENSWKPKPKLSWQLLDDGQFRFPKCRPLRTGSRESGVENREPANAVVSWLQPVGQDERGTDAGSECWTYDLPYFKPTGLVWMHVCVRRVECKRTGSFADTDMWQQCCLRNTQLTDILVLKFLQITKAVCAPVNACTFYRLNGNSNNNGVGNNEN